MTSQTTGPSICRISSDLFPDTIVILQSGGSDAEGSGHPFYIGQCHTACGGASDEVPGKVILLGCLDGNITAVVQNKELDGQVKSFHCFQLLYVHDEPAVAFNADGALSTARQASSDGRGNTKSHGPEALTVKNTQAGFDPDRLHGALAACTGTAGDQQIVSSSAHRRAHRSGHNR